MDEDVWIAVVRLALLLSSARRFRARGSHPADRLPPVRMRCKHRSPDCCHVGRQRHRATDATLGPKTGEPHEAQTSGPSRRSRLPAHDAFARLPGCRRCRSALHLCERASSHNQPSRWRAVRYRRLLDRCSTSEVPDASRDRSLDRFELPSGQRPVASAAVEARSWQRAGAR